MRKESHSTTEMSQIMKKILQSNVSNSVDQTQQHNICIVPKQTVLQFHSVSDSHRHLIVLNVKTVIIVFLSLKHCDVSGNERRHKRDTPAPEMDSRLWLFN